MSIEQLKTLMPDFGKDIKLNLTSLLTTENNPSLSKNQILGSMLASAYATRQPILIQAFENEFKGSLSDQEVFAAKGAASLMAMNNVYYRSAYYTDDPEIKQLPAKLRMTLIGNPGIEKLDFEIYCLAVSAINGCSACVKSHADVIQKHNVTKEGVQLTFKIGAIVNAVAQVLSIGE